MQDVYAYKNNIKVVQESASGGAFSKLVSTWKKMCIEKGQDEKNIIVYGAAFDADFNVVHIRTVDDEWKRLRGSKYTVSDLRGIFSSVKEDLSRNRAVMFTGTPCQVKALKNYLMNDDISDLVTIDIICHGTVEKKVWVDYVNCLEKKNASKLKEYSFRYKKGKSAEPEVFASFENGKTEIGTRSVQSYMSLFFTLLPLRKSCYLCRFANMNRPSDITIGDFWGAENIFKAIDIKDGISEIIVNTDIGVQLMTRVMNYIGSDELLIKCETEQFIDYQHNLKGPVQMPANVDDFWEFYENNGYKMAIDNYTDCGKKKIFEFYAKRFLKRKGLKKNLKNLLKR